MGQAGGGDLTRLSVAELTALRERIDVELERRGSERDRGLRERGGLVESSGPRYRNPENPSETWSGRGPRPAWVERALARGLDLERLAVADDRPVPTRGER